MLILALDTSGRMASCCLYEDGKKRSSCFKDSQLQHSRTILPICEQMLKEQNVSLDDIDAFAACIGPGSFTGIRIGVAIIKGFALAGGKPAAGVSSLEAAAAAVPENGLICSIIKAREDEYYYGFFRRNDMGFFRICPDGCLTGSELKTLLYGADWLLCGDGVSDFLAGNPCQRVRDTKVVQSAEGVAMCAWDLANCGGLEDAGEVNPLYLKKTQAERMREENNR